MTASTATASDSALPRPGRASVVLLWVVQIAVAGMFLLAGGGKLAGAAAMVQLFDAVGIGQWFRYVTGAIEVTSAVAMLIPTLAPFGALALIATMTGAIVAHLFILHTSPLMPIILLLGAAFVAWKRRDRLMAVASGRR
jgi:putative oxidoreductase